MHARREASEETNPVNTLILAPWPPECSPASQWDGLEFWFRKRGMPRFDKDALRTECTASPTLAVGLRQSLSPHCL